jgi:phytoene synthase
LERTRAGRLYLPLTWLRDAGIDPDRFIERPEFSPALGAVIRSVLAHADRLYRRSAPAIAALPVSCRPAIHTARVLYAEIGREIERQGFDSVSQRAVVPPRRKLEAMLLALPTMLLIPPGENLKPLAATQFLLDAMPVGLARGSAVPPWYRVRDRAIWVIDLFERLERERRSQVQRVG